MQRAGAEQLVQRGVDEAVREAGGVVGDRYHPGHERRGQAGAADPVLAVVGAVGEHLDLADQHAGVRVGGHRDVGNGPVRPAGEGPRDGRGTRPFW